MQTQDQAKTPYEYARRRPELTPCYRILQKHLETFLADRQAEGRPLPDYVIEEFEAYLRCGIPAHGFLRLACHGCGQEKIAVFSCKKRGFCPSCCAKRMAEAADHLVENVLPHIPYRQFVITFPIPMRYWLHTNRDLFAKVHRIIIREIHRYHKNKAIARSLKEPVPGTISFTQRWGSALNLNPHLHIVCCDGVYTRNTKGEPRFRTLEPITDGGVETLLRTISRKVMRHLTKQGYLDKQGEVVLNPTADDIFTEHQALAQATASSIAGKIAFGPNAGRYVTKIGKGFGFAEEIPLAKGRRCFKLNGFSLHANTAVKSHQRQQLRKLIEYIARGPLSNERLTITDDGKVKLQLKRSFDDGTSHLLFTPEEFIEKLSALIPPPRRHLVRWAGCFAPNSPYRKQITLKPELKKGFPFPGDCRAEEGSDEPPPVRNSSWSRMLAKVFNIDVSTCDACGGDLRAICAVTDPDSVARYLRHLNVDPDPPSRSPPRRRQGELAFDQIAGGGEDAPVIYLD